MIDNYFIGLTKTEQLNFQIIPAWLLDVVGHLRQSYFQVYLVGGAVRDLLNGESPKDWDLATDALPEQIENLFRNTIPTGKIFGTITVLDGENKVEVTTLREDLGHQDGRHPQQVHFGKDIRKDLERRDFTINAIAYDFNQQLLIDPFQGRRDLYHRVLKTVGDPKTRFAEDGLRMFRFYRFLATMDLKPEFKTVQAIDPTLAKYISFERIRDEFSKLLQGPFVRRSLEGMQKSHLLQAVIPELDLDKESAGSGGRRNLWNHLMIAVETIQPELQLRWAALLHDIAKPQTRFEDFKGIHFYGHDKIGAELSRVILERLRYPNILIDKVGKLIQWHMFNLPLNASDAAIRKFVAKAGEDLIPNLLELRRADIVASGNVDFLTWQFWDAYSKHIRGILVSGETVTQNKLAINGHVLISQLSLKPGPVVGEILSYLLNLVNEDPGLNTSEQLIKLANDYCQNK